MKGLSDKKNKNKFLLVQLDLVNQRIYFSYFSDKNCEKIE